MSALLAQSFWHLIGIVIALLSLVYRLISMSIKKDLDILKLELSSEINLKVNEAKKDFEVQIRSLKDHEKANATLNLKILEKIDKKLNNINIKNQNNESIFDIE